MTMANIHRGYTRSSPAQRGHNPGPRCAPGPQPGPTLTQVGNSARRYTRTGTIKAPEELKAAQAAADKLQGIVEAAVICLLEHRIEYSLEKFGIIEAYCLQRKIEVLGGAATIGSIIIAGIEYLKIHGLPCTSQDRLLGKCTFLSFNQEGALHGFTDLSTLSLPAQEDRLDKYNQVHGKTVSGFLNHFAGSGTFHQRPEVTVKHGIRCTSLQDAMTNIGIRIDGFQGPGWGIVNVMEKLEEQVYHNMVEMALTDFETLKGPIETRTALL